jgi:hypothetical protein
MSDELKPCPICGATADCNRLLDIRKITKQDLNDAVILVVRVNDENRFSGEPEVISFAKENN